MRILADDTLRVDLAKALLRVSIGGMMLLHGVRKLGHGIEGIEGMFAEHGLPSFLASFVYLGEVVAPLMLIVGLGSRIGGAAIVATMLVAIGLAHPEDALALHERTGAWRIELQMLYLVGGLAIGLLGSGRYAISRGRGRFD